MKVIRSKFAYIGLIVVITVLVFSGIRNTFYQQDEWHGYGVFLIKGSGIVLDNVKNVFDLFFARGRMLNNVLLYLLYSFDLLGVRLFSIFAVTFHALNAALLYLLVRRIVRSNLAAFLGSLYFAFNALSQNAVVWMAAATSNLPSTTLILLSIFSFYEHLKTNRKKWILITFSLTYLSLFFKEQGIFLFLLYPLAGLIFKKQTIGKFAKSFWYFVLFVVALSVYRVSQIVFGSTSNSLLVSSSDQAYWFVLLKRAVIYPTTSFSLSFLPPEPMIAFARAMTNIFYPSVAVSQFVLFSQTVVLEQISLVLAAAMFAILYFLYTKLQKEERKWLLFFVVFMLMSFLPYIVLSKNFAYLESRYYYLSSLAGGVILAFVIKKIRIISYLLVGALIFWHLGYVQQEIKFQIDIAQIRKDIISQISEYENKLSDKNIFIVSSDEDFYALGNKLPFQQGTGYTLMAIFYESGKIPSELLENQFLFEIGSQGYQEVGELGFGFYHDEKQMQQELNNNFEVNIIDLSPVTQINVN